MLTESIPVIEPSAFGEPMPDYELARYEREGELASGTGLGLAERVLCAEVRRARREEAHWREGLDQLMDYIHSQQDDYEFKLGEKDGRIRELEAELAPLRPTEPITLADVDDLPSHWDGETWAPAGPEMVEGYKGLFVLPDDPYGEKTSRG